MNILDIRKSFLWSFIAFLSITALIAIVSVLSNNWGDTQLKVLATTFAISASSICAMSCAAFLEKHGKNIFGFIGITCAVVSCGLTIAGIWGDIGIEGYWKITVVLIVAAIAMAYALLLLRPRLAPNHKWSQAFSVVCISALALEIIVAVCGEITDEGYFRLIAVTYIITVLMTLIVPIFMILTGKEPADHLDHLVLRKVADDIYTDQSGRRLRVTQVEP